MRTVKVSSSPSRTLPAALGYSSSRRLGGSVGRGVGNCDGLANLQSRGLRADRSLLVILDGAPALHKARRAVFGEAALIQRCQVHKLRNILEHLPERQRPWVQAIVRRAYQATNVKTATRLLTDLAEGAVIGDWQGTGTRSVEDYDARSGTLAFNAGETSKTVAVTVRADKKFEFDEMFYLNLSGAAGAFVMDSQGVGVVRNDDR